jgi:GNAT superfamily N-acetyltransferase
MIEIKTYPKFQEFLDNNQSEILGNYFIYYHLLQMIEMLNNEQIDLYDAYNIKDENNNSIICLFVTGAYYFYGDNWTDELITALLEKIEIHNFKNFSFIGQKNLILNILERANVSFQIVKDRIIYKCQEVLPFSRTINGEVKNASFDDFDELVTMCYDYYIEEYNGERKRTIEEISKSVQYGVETSNLFVIKSENKICSIVHVINKASDNPFIGNLFTKPEFRNHGFAYLLLHTVTKGLINNGFIQCGLVSDASNPASNKIFTRIGYVPIYKLIFTYKK